MPETKDAAVAAVGLKLPKFWPKIPEIWFAQAEVVFTIRGITVDRTKYSYIVTALDPDTAARIKDLLMAPPTDGNYDAIKERLTGTFVLSEQERAFRILNLGELGDRMPSELIDEILGLCDDHGLCFLASQTSGHALPHALQLQMDGVDFTDPHKAAKKADSLWSTHKQLEATTCTISATSKGNSAYNVRASDAPVGWCHFHRKFRDKVFRCRAPCSHPTAGNIFWRENT